MSVNAPSLPLDELREQAVEMLEDGASAATAAVAPLAEHARDLRLERELRAAAGRIADEAEDVLDEIERADIDRRALLAVLLLTAVLALIVVLAARRRRDDERRSAARSSSPAS